MTTKEHYDNHLASFYSWMIGDIKQATNVFKNFCFKHKIAPQNTTAALDLGAGNGIQSVALQQLGFKVTAIDFNAQLLNELKAQDSAIETVLDDIRNVNVYAHLNLELIVCCGDTITHLESFDEVKKLVHNVFALLPEKGKFILSFRDYSSELTDTQRFIPVKSDAQRVFTCFLEYFTEKVRVTDLLYEKEGDVWKQKISSYCKVRLNTGIMTDYLKQSGFKIAFNETNRGLITMIAEKE